MSGFTDWYWSLWGVVLGIVVLVGISWALACVMAYAELQTILHHIGIGPDEWFYWLVLVLVGSCPRDRCPGGH